MINIWHLNPTWHKIQNACFSICLSYSGMYSIYFLYKVFPHPKFSFKAKKERTLIAPILKKKLKTSKLLMKAVSDCIKNLGQDNVSRRRPGLGLIIFSGLCPSPSLRHSTFFFNLTALTLWVRYGNTFMNRDEMKWKKRKKKTWSQVLFNNGWWLEDTEVSIPKFLDPPSPGAPRDKLAHSATAEQSTSLKDTAEDVGEECDSHQSLISLLKKREFKEFTLKT